MSAEQLVCGKEPVTVGGTEWVLDANVEPYYSAERERGKYFMDQVLTPGRLSPGHVQRDTISSSQPQGAIYNTSSAIDLSETLQRGRGVDASWGQAAAQEEQQRADIISA